MPEEYLKEESNPKEERRLERALTSDEVHRQLWDGCILATEPRHQNSEYELVQTTHTLLTVENKNKQRPFWKCVVLATFWCCLARHQKSGASAAVLVLPSATPEEQSERGRDRGNGCCSCAASRDTRRAERARPFWCCLARHQKSRASSAVIEETVAARVPPWYAFGEQGRFCD
ncbi:hypothetical protein NDU88_000869 [Pleurodeles waltl]|uniref:Uncharacterized protein n=1 Tax=Pleurodeles waltl TaxID=8319 RepID=A0AAV7VZS2_PLEWA|nr:hypothetical protein NDU88_000869 [Pleurodeles waltl]